MKTKLVLNFLALSSFALLPASSFANNNSAQDTDKSSDVRTLTGCLAKGDSAGEYNLTADDGSTWEVRSKTTKLSTHVGHTVTVTGKVWHPNMHAAKEKAKDEVSDNANEHGHLRVTSLSMVSESCKK